MIFIALLLLHLNHLSNDIYRVAVFLELTKIFTDYRCPIFLRHTVTLDREPHATAGDHKDVTQFTLLHDNNLLPPKISTMEHSNVPHRTKFQVSSFIYTL